MNRAVDIDHILVNHRCVGIDTNGLFVLEAAPSRYNIHSGVVLVFKANTDGSHRASRIAHVITAAQRQPGFIRSDHIQKSIRGIVGGNESQRLSRA